MGYTRLQPFQENEDGISIMVLAKDSSTINENEYYLHEENTIQKVKRSRVEPEFIILLDEDNIFKGLFKRTHVADNDEDAAMMWTKVN